MLGLIQLMQLNPMRICFKMGITNFVLSILVMLLGYHIAFLAFNFGETFFGTLLFILGVLVTTMGISIFVEGMK